MRIILINWVYFMKSTLALALLAFASATSFAATDEFTLTIKNHVFEPKEIKLPAGQKVKLQVINADPTPAEFESKPLGREKVIPGKTTATINLGPLKPGRYPFVEEYHETEAGAQGTIIVE
jgi:plastocyanin